MLYEKPATPPSHHAGLPRLFRVFSTQRLGPPQQVHMFPAEDGVQLLALHAHGAQRPQGPPGHEEPGVRR